MRARQVQTASCPTPTEQTPRRTGTRTGGRPVATLLISATASLALVSACAGGASADSTREPGAPDSTSPTEATTSPSATPSPSPSDGDSDGSDEDGNTGEYAPIGDISDAVFPACGDTFVLPERTSDVVVESGPDGAVGSGGTWLADVTHDAPDGSPVEGPTSLENLVLVDADGRVVSTPDPDSDVFWGAEGGFVVGVPTGGSAAVPIRVGTDCETQQALAPGDYEAYPLVTFPGVDGDLEQAQGGPFPLEITEDDGTAVEPLLPGTAVPATGECAEPVPASIPTSGTPAVELIDPLRTPRDAADDIDGRLSFVTDEALTTDLVADVVLIADTKRVNAPLATDAITSFAMGEGTVVHLSVRTLLQGCDGSELPTGDYEAVVVVWGFDADRERVAVASSASLDLQIT